LQPHPSQFLAQGRINQKSNSTKSSRIGDQFATRLGALRGLDPASYGDPRVVTHARSGDHLAKS